MATNRTAENSLNTSYLVSCGEVVDDTMLNTIMDAAVHGWERGDHVYSHGHLNLLQIDTSDTYKGTTINGDQYWDWFFPFTNNGYNKCTVYWKYRLDGSGSGDNGSFIYCKYFDYNSGTVVNFDDDGIAITDTLVGSGNGICAYTDGSKWSGFSGAVLVSAETLYEGCATFDIPNATNTNAFQQEHFGVRLGRSVGSTPNSGDTYEYGLFYFNIHLWGDPA